MAAIALYRCVDHKATAPQIFAKIEDLAFLRGQLDRFPVARNNYAQHWHASIRRALGSNSLDGDWAGSGSGALFIDTGATLKGAKGRAEKIWRLTDEGLETARSPNFSLRVVALVEHAFMERSDISVSQVERRLHRERAAARAGGDAASQSGVVWPAVLNRLARCEPSAPPEPRPIAIDLPTAVLVRAPAPAQISAPPPAAAASPRPPSRFYEVVSKPAARAKLVAEIAAWIKANYAASAAGEGVVYALSHKDADALALGLREAGVSASAYHLALEEEWAGGGVGRGRFESPHTFAVQCGDEIDPAAQEGPQGRLASF